MPLAEHPVFYKRLRISVLPTMPNCRSRRKEAEFFRWDEICVTSHEYDRSKLRAYATAGVKECWLVLAPEKQIEVHRQPQGEQFAEHSVHGPGGTLTSVAVPSLTVELDRLFAASRERLE